jgi:hypothetical protein
MYMIICRGPSVRWWCCGLRASHNPLLETQSTETTYAEEVRGSRQDRSSRGRPGPGALTCRPVEHACVSSVLEPGRRPGWTTEAPASAPYSPLPGRSRRWQPAARRPCRLRRERARPRPVCRGGDGDACGAARVGAAWTDGWRWRVRPRAGRGPRRNRRRSRLTCPRPASCCESSATAPRAPAYTCRSTCDGDLVMYGNVADVDGPWRICQWCLTRQPSCNGIIVRPMFVASHLPNVDGPEAHVHCSTPNQKGESYLAPAGAEMCFTRGRGNLGRGPLPWL